jgi:hypothetical protein
MLVPPFWLAPQAARCDAGLSGCPRGDGVKSRIRRIYGLARPGSGDMTVGGCGVRQPGPAAEDRRGTPVGDHHDDLSTAAKTAEARTAAAAAARSGTPAYGRPHRRSAPPGSPDFRYPIRARHRGRPSHAAAESWPAPSLRAVGSGWRRVAAADGSAGGRSQSGRQRRGPHGGGAGVWADPGLGEHPYSVGAENDHGQA